MAYSVKARAIRRCIHIDPKTDHHCKCFALWNDPEDRGLCVHHAGRHHRGPMPEESKRYRAQYVPCRCAAYNWPHRPGGGLCRWPDPPVFQRTTPAGTHRRGRLRLPRYFTSRGIHTAKQALRVFGL